ncbi:FtsX-like permease family protein [Mucilaginibacter sp. L3T2-6]|uniref:FtsX-like permease family protein n=1 Tax=Mucilaginibacter sp. L3T2-6 TaxID=3062491 RepID=UPI002676154C|nr:FtsX-like permease family protein [Mucilaginibacter sp. L3T2-6]MDO3641990.1 ABC transporter permease [Mucilaginibacter sp. L3T2-6]MDV6214332.1 FtsX-like permease family protein [Mucilaginibacter sp. L3T2-6]
MNTSIYIAKRYLFSRKKMHAINIISGISMVGVLIGSAALIIILSVFNGFEEVILSLYSNFTAELKIEPKLGKSFNPNTAYFNALRKDPKVFSFIEVLQEKVLIKYDNRPFIGEIKGVSAQFMKRGGMDSICQSGTFTLKKDGNNFAVIGSAVQNSLGVSVRDQFTPIEIYSPNRNAGNAVNPLNEFNVRAITPSGVFTLGQEFDDMVITPIDFARDLLNEPVNVTSLELNFNKGVDISAMQDEVQQKAGKDFIVKNRSQQNTELYKTLNYERWFIFMILVFVLIIAIFNIIGSLTMLVMDKRKDIAILTSLGANRRLIQGIFFFEGMMISVIGCIAGIFLGLIFCILQQRFGLVKMGAQTAIIDAYPVALKFRDFILVFLTVGIISVIASGISARLSIKGLDDIKQDL